MIQRSIDRRGFTLLEVLFVVALIGVISVIAVPMMGNTLGFFRIAGDVRSLTNQTAVVKMRAASEFTRVRLRVDLSSKTFKIEYWDKTAADWKMRPQDPTTTLSSTVNFGFGSVGTPPPNSQAAIAQAPKCTDKDGADISGTACMIFNSRGVPIDITGAPTASDAIYLTDGSAVYGLTIAATGMIRMWRTGNKATPTWVKN